MANSSSHHQLPPALSSEKPEGCWNKFERYYNKLIDADEVSYQAMISWPLMVMLSTFYSLNVVSVMFAGNFGNLQLAASNLAHSWAIITGFSFIFGLNAAVEALCRQAYRDRMDRMLQVHLQTSCIISFVFSTAIALLWWHSDTILIHLFHQNHDIAKEAGVYLKFLIPGLFGYGFLQNVLRFLRAHSILEVTVIFPLVYSVIHIGIIAYGLVHWTSLGFKAASLATSISIWIQLIIFGLVMFFSNSLNHISWDRPFSFESFHRILAYLKLALPSAALVCLEYCGYEILVLLAGLMPKPETSISIIAMSVNIQAIAHMLFSGMSVGVSTRVANELRAGNPDGAKHVAAVGFKLTIVYVGALCVALLNHHTAWAGFFSDSAEITNKFTSMIPLLLISFILEFTRGNLSGVAIGCGWERCAICIDLAGFYVIGIPIAVLVAFKFIRHAQYLLFYDADWLDMWSSLPSFWLIATDIIDQIMEKIRGLNKYQ